MLHYEDLFGPNVAGTAELVRLALTNRQKRIDFVSSVATTYLLDRGAGNDEDSPLRQKIALSDDYGNGYGASKWAAEQLLHSAHRRFGLPVNVFRGDMMLAHRRYHGQINVPDIFTRLLYSVVMTGLAPASFYVSRPDGSRPGGAHTTACRSTSSPPRIVGIGARAAPGDQHLPRPQPPRRRRHLAGHVRRLDRSRPAIPSSGSPATGSGCDSFEAKLRRSPRISASTRRSTVLDIAPPSVSRR